MIIDAHAHAFPSLHDHVGYASAEEHMRAAQAHVVAPSQPVIETATGRVVTEPTVSDGKGLGWSSLLDVNFRYGKFGCMEWTHKGKDYHLQMFAPTFPDSLPPERMIALMILRAWEKPCCTMPTCTACSMITSAMQCASIPTASLALCRFTRRTVTKETRFAN